MKTQKTIKTTIRKLKDFKHKFLKKTIWQAGRAAGELQCKQ